MGDLTTFNSSPFQECYGHNSVPNSFKQQHKYIHTNKQKRKNKNKTTQNKTGGYIRYFLSTTLRF